MGGVNAPEENPPARIRGLTNGEGVDVALQLTLTPKVTEQAIESVGKGGGVIIVVGWGGQK